MNNMNKLIAFCIFVAVTMILLTGCTRDSKSEATFLNHKMYINGLREDKTKINLIFIDDRNNPELKHILNKAQKISFYNVNGIEVNEHEVNDGDNYKDMRLYSLIVGIKYSTPGTYKTDKIAVYLDDGNIIYYRIGECTFNVYDDRETSFEINSHTSVSRSLHTYSFTLTSISPQRIKIQDIDVGDFEKYKKELIALVNNKEINNFDNVSLNKGDKIEIKIVFNDLKEYDLYCFNPVLKYEKDGHIHVYTPIYTMYGLPFNEGKIRSVYQKYNEDVQ